MNSPSWLYAIALLAAAPLLRAAAADCDSLRTLALPQTTIDKAETIAAGVFPPEGGGANALRNLPSFCRVAATIRPSPDSDIRIEVWLPTSGWNGKFQGVGNGGYAGSLNLAGVAGAIQQGYASATTDTGHQGGDARWALGHPEKVIDFGWRAIHETAVAGKAITKAFYGQAPKRSYFNSCSNGGRQALMEAQRFPDDYDGIIAGAPANYWTRLMALAMSSMKATLAKPESYISAKKLKAIENAALEACDARDGVRDNVLEEPLACRPDYSRLLCGSGPENDNCLTAPQLEALQAVYAGPRNAKGARIFPGVSPGGEAQPGGWAGWITGAAPEQAAMFFFGTNFFKNIVYGNPDWDFRTFEVDRDLKAAEAKAAAALNATDPDLRKFAARGGKLILYHGWCDAAIPAENTIDYWRSVEQRMGAKKTRAFARLFLAPGVQHCAGGAGPNVFGQGGPRKGVTAENDLNMALERWVEQGIAPERLIAAKTNATGGIERTRPLCAYPLVARYQGSGSTDEAANFACAAPAATK